MPVSSPHNCDSWLTQKVSELEGRMSTLYQLRDKGRLLDTLVTVGASEANSYSRMIDTTVLCMDVATSQPVDR